MNGPPLGHEISRLGHYHQLPVKLKPQNKDELKSFLGIIGCCRCFNPRFTEIAALLCKDVKHTKHLINTLPYFYTCDCNVQSLPHVAASCEIFVNCYIIDGAPCLLVVPVVLMFPLLYCCRLSFKTFIPCVVSATLSCFCFQLSLSLLMRACLCVCACVRAL